MRPRKAIARENAEYIYGKRRLREIDRRVRFLSKRLDEITVVHEPPNDAGRVFFGAWVTVEDDDGEEHTYRIVGADESDLDRGCISIDSPVARALLGKRDGDEVTVRVPQGRRHVHDRRYPVLMTAARRACRWQSPSRSTTSAVARVAVALPPALRRYARIGGALARRLRGHRAARRRRDLRGDARGDRARRKRTICFEIYILASDHTGDRFKEALIARAKAGVAIRVDLRRASARSACSSAYVAELRAAGIQVIDFNPIAPWRARCEPVASRSPQDPRRRRRDRRSPAASTSRTTTRRSPTAASAGTTCTAACAARSSSISRGCSGGPGCARRRATIPHRRRASHAHRASAAHASCGCSTTRKRRQRTSIRRAYLHVIRRRGARADPERVLLAGSRAASCARARRRARRRRARDRAGHERRQAWSSGPSLYVYRRLARCGVKMLRWRGAMMHAKTAMVDAAVVDDRQLQLRRDEPVQQPRGHRRDPRREVGHDARRVSSTATPPTARRSTDRRLGRRCRGGSKALAWIGFRLRAGFLLSRCPMSLAHKAARGALWTVVSSMGGRAIGVVGTLVMTRFLAPDDDRRGLRRDDPVR